MIILLYLLVFFNEMENNEKSIENFFKNLLFLYEQHTEESRNKITIIKNSTKDPKLAKICRKILDNWDYISRIKDEVVDSVLLYMESLIDDLNKCKDNENVELTSPHVLEITITTNGKVKNIKYLKAGPNKCQKMIIEKAVYSSYWLPAMQNNKFIEQKKTITIITDFE